MGLKLVNKWHKHVLISALFLLLGALPLTTPSSNYFNSIAHAGFLNNDLETFEEIVDLVAEKYVYSPDHKKLFTAAIENLIKTQSGQNVS